MPAGAQVKKTSAGTLLIDKLVAKYKGQHEIEMNTVYGNLQATISTLYNKKKQPVFMTFDGECNDDVAESFINSLCAEKEEQGYLYSGTTLMVTTLKGYNKAESYTMKVYKKGNQYAQFGYIKSKDRSNKPAFSACFAFVVGDITRKDGAEQPFSL